MPSHSCQNKVGKDEAEVILHTSKGDITVKLFPTLAPKASENFLKHAKDKYYDGLTFHRVIKDFMIQSGDLRVTVLAENLSGRKVSLLSLHHSSTTSVAHLPWPILVLKIQTQPILHCSKQGRSKQAIRKCWLSKTYH